MKRAPDWQLRFEGFVRAHATQPFAWGRNDCALFAADCIEALTVERVCEDLRGQYGSEREALRLLQQLGGLHGLATRALGAPIPVLCAAVGDIVLAKLDDRECLAVCNGTNVIAAGMHGMVTLPLRAATAAWRVG